MDSVNMPPQGRGLPPATTASDSGGAAGAGASEAAQQEVPPCEVCGSAPSKYCCPRCYKRTCGLACVKGEAGLGVQRPPLCCAD